MNKSIITNSSEEFIWATISRSNPVKHNSAFEFQVEFPHNGKNSKNWICKLKPGLILSLNDVTYMEDVVNHVETKEDCLKFAYFLSGKGNVNYNFLDTQLKRDFDEELVHHSYVYFSPEIEGKIRFKAGSHLQQFSIHISPSVLLNYFNGQFDIGPFVLREILAGSDQTSFFHTDRISNSMRVAIDQILNCPYSGAMRQLFIESKTMELITYKMDQIIQAKPVRNHAPRLKKEDYGRIKKAAGILINNLENPPGLFDLAKNVGTTHTRLNIGFRQIYGTTAFGYLRQVRLEKARQLLEKDGLNVTQAAYEVGYNSIPSFSKAFSVYFGINPTKYKKRLF